MQLKQYSVKIVGYKDGTILVLPASFNLNTNRAMHQ